MAQAYYHCILHIYVNCVLSTDDYKIKIITLKNTEDALELYALVSNIWQSFNYLFKDKHVVLTDVNICLVFNKQQNYIQLYV